MSNFLQELIIQERQLALECENSPKFRRLLAIRTLIQHEKGRISSSSEGGVMGEKRGRRKGSKNGRTTNKLLTTPEEREAIANAIEEYLKDTNKPATVREFSQFLQSKNITIPGKNQGVTIGAVLNGNKDKFQLGENRLWGLISN